MKKCSVIIGVCLLLGTGVLFAVPATRVLMLRPFQPARLIQGKPVGDWLHALNAPEPDARRAAALTLGESPCFREETPDAAEFAAVRAALLATLDDSDAFVRKCAASSLLMIPRDRLATMDPPGPDAVTKKLGDSEALVRRFAARALSCLGPKAGSAVVELTACMKDSDDGVRAEAVRALGNIGAGAATAAPEILERLKGDDAAEVRELAARALGLMGWDALGPHGGRALAELRHTLKDPAREIRAQAARSLGQFGSRAKPAVAELLIIAKEKDEAVRAPAAAALMRIDPDSARKAGIH